MHFNPSLLVSSAAALLLVPTISAAPFDFSDLDADASATASSSTAAAPAQSLAPVVHAQDDLTQLDNLKVAQSLELLYGADTEDANSTTASITVPELKYPAVRLDTTIYVSSISCTDSDAKIVFNNSEAYQVAASNWASQTGEFLLITYHDGCGDGYGNSQRDFVLIDSISTDDSSMTISGHIDHVNFQDAIDGNTDIRLSINNWVPASADPDQALGYTTLTDSNTPRGLSETISFSSPVGTAQTPWGAGVELYQGAADGGKAEVYCVGCGVNGKVTLSTTFHFSFFKGVTAGSLNANGVLHAALQLGVVGDYSFNQNVNVPLSNLPLSVLSIPGIISAGPGLTLNAGANVNVNDKGQMLAGLTFDWPDVSAELDILQPSSSSANGFTDPQINRVFRAPVGISANADAYLEMGLGIEVNILNGMIVKKVALVDKPDVSISAISNGPVNGAACGGVGFDVGIGNELNVDLIGMPNKNINTWKGPSYNDCIVI